jgi:transcriptional regulator with XRE-family HTH domain
LHKDLQSVFASNLKRIRLGKGFSQEKLAELAGLDRTYVSSCERGRRNASLKSVERLAKALQISPETLLNTAPGAKPHGG